MTDNAATAADSHRSPASFVLLLAALLAARYAEYTLRLAPLLDERVYVNAGRAVLRGASPFDGEYLYLPAFAWLAARFFEFWGEGAFLALLRIGNLVAAAIFAWLGAAKSGLSRPACALLAIAFLFLSPAVLSSIETGNPTFLVGLLIFLAIETASRRPLGAGALLGASLLIKPLAPGVVAWLAGSRFFSEQAPNHATHSSGRDSPNRHPREGGDPVPIRIGEGGLGTGPPPSRGRRSGPQRLFQGLSWTDGLFPGTGLIAAVVAVVFFALGFLPLDLAADFLRQGPTPASMEHNPSVYRLLETAHLSVPPAIYTGAVCLAALALAARRRRPAAELYLWALPAMFLALPLVWNHTLTLSWPIQAAAFGLAVRRGRRVEILAVAGGMVLLACWHGVHALPADAALARWFFTAAPALTPFFLAAYRLRLASAPEP